MAVLRLKASTQGLNNALAAMLKKRIAGVTPAASKEIATEGAKFAKQGYKEALYDGEHDAVVSVEQAGVRTYAVVARGKSVPYIEYGTGVLSQKPGKSREYWYFPQRGRKIKLTAGGKKITTYKKGGYDRLSYKTARGFTRGVGLDSQYLYQENGQWFYTTGYKKADSERPVTEEHVPETIENRNKTAYYTTGNPPNLIMQRTRDYMAEIAPEIVKKHIRTKAK